MLEQLEALRALKQAGTTAQAAVALRVTQSAVSKRLAALEATCGASLVERDGRRLKLTPAAERLLLEATPLLTELSDVLAAARKPNAADRETLKVAASESLLSSWLPEVLARAASDLAPRTGSAEPVRLELHAHRGPALVERVRSGDYVLAICVASGAAGELIETHLSDERMVLVPSGLRALSVAERREPVPCWTIEERSLTWAALSPKLRQRERPWKLELRPEGRLESFTALVQVARAGFAHALVPRGTALALGVPADALVALPGLTRPLVAITRHRALERETVSAFLVALRSAWPRA